MPTGKGRKAPPSGYMTPGRAAELLGSRSNLYKLQDAGRLHKHIPPGKSHGYYSVSEVQAVIEANRAFFEGYQPGDYHKHPSSSFSLATEEDMPTIYDISARIFSEPPPLETRIIWLRKNPETFHVLRNQEGVIRGFSSLLPLKQETLTRFVHDQIESEQITADDVETFQPGKTIHIYIMALAVDPACSTAEKHVYGFRIVNGVFSFLLDLAQRGIQIETITARTYKPDGLRLLRKLGFPQLRSPVPGKNLFVVRVAESGMPFFVKYGELLDQWRDEHIVTYRIPTRQRAQTPRDATSTRPTLPDAWSSWTPFIERHGISSERRPLKVIARADYCEPGEYMQPSKQGMTLVKCALSPDGQARLLEAIKALPLGQELIQCEVGGCPCHEILDRTLWGDS